MVAARYRILRKLGEGGIGIVYEAEHLVLGKHVAIKCLHPQFAASPSIVRRFHNEAIAATSIGHPHIVEVIDMGRFADGTFFMALELLEGGGPRGAHRARRAADDRARRARGAAGV